MAKNIDICITAKDNYTAVVSKIQNHSKNFGKTVDEMKKIDALNKNKATLRVEADDAFEQGDKSILQIKSGIT